jgi:hypothetical protein
MISPRAARSACAAFLVSAGAALGCATPSPAPATSVPDPLSGMPALYVLDNAGALSRSGFEHQPWQRIATGVADRSNVAIDSSSRWMLVRGQKPREWRLIELRTGLQRTIALPAGLVVDPVFSPDGRTLATYLVFGPTGQSGLWLIDSATGRVRRVGQARRHGDDDERVDLRWAADGQSLYLLLQGEGWSTYRYDVARERFSPVFGHEETIDEDLAFLRFGRRVALVPRPQPQSMRFARDVSSPDGALTARVGSDYALRVVPLRGRPKVVARGAYSGCMGTTILIRGWAGGHRLLVFTLDEIDYVYSTPSGRISRLFPEPARATAFLW